MSLQDVVHVSVLFVWQLFVFDLVEAALLDS
jgi:hypothetical protein